MSRQDKFVWTDIANEVTYAVEHPNKLRAHNTQYQMSATTASVVKTVDRPEVLTASSSTFWSMTKTKSARDAVNPTKSKFALCTLKFERKVHLQSCLIHNGYTYGRQRYPFSISDKYCCSAHSSTNTHRCNEHLFKTEISFIVEEI